MERVNSTVERVGKRIRKLEDSTEEFIRMTVRWNTYKHTHTHTHTHRMNIYELKRMDLENQTYFQEDIQKKREEKNTPQ
jgi:hypothetical protein